MAVLNAKTFFNAINALNIMCPTKESVRLIAETATFVGNFNNAMIIIQIRETDVLPAKLKTVGSVKGLLYPCAEE